MSTVSEQHPVTWEALLPLLSSPACKPRSFFFQFCCCHPIAIDPFRQMMKALLPLNDFLSDLPHLFLASTSFFEPTYLLILDALYLLRPLLHSLVLQQKILWLQLPRFFELALNVLRHTLEFFEISQLLRQPYSLVIQFFLFSVFLLAAFSSCLVTLSFLSCLSSLLFSKLLNLGPLPPEFWTSCPLLHLTTKIQWTTHSLSPQSPACISPQPCWDVGGASPAAPPRPYIGFGTEFTDPFLPSHRS